MVIPFIIAQIKKNTCYEGGDCACPLGSPMRNGMVLLLLSQGYPLGGSQVEWCDTPMNVQVFSHFS
jgi:hypothetical protein